MFKTATFKVFLEFLPDVIRQYPALGRPLRLENGIVLFDKLVKKGPLWVMALVLRRTLAQTGFPASRQPQHDRVLAMGCLHRGYQTASSAAPETPPK